MTNFSTKKIHTTPIKKQETIAVAPKIQDTKKRTRTIIAVILILLGCLFGVNYVVQGI